MTLLNKEWKNNWCLKSFSQDELFEIIKKVIFEQIESLDKNKITLNSNFFNDYDADSVDIVSILLTIEELFINGVKETELTIPLDNLGQIVLVEDLFSIIYQILIEMEKKLELDKKSLKLLKS
jgi:acyl carrier protein